MDIDVFPNSLRILGPNGMISSATYRFAGYRSRRQQRRHRFGAARATADQGVYSDRYRTAVSQAPIQMAGRDRPRPAGQKWGYVQVGGYSGRLHGWTQTQPSAFN